jgi:hypothetical protein
VSRSPITAQFPMDGPSLLPRTGAVSSSFGTSHAAGPSFASEPVSVIPSLAASELPAKLEPENIFAHCAQSP